MPHYTISGTISLIPFPPRDSRSRHALGLTIILSYYNDERDKEARERERERRRKKTGAYLARDSRGAA